MPAYLVEAYAAGLTPDGLRVMSVRAARTAEAMSERGVPVLHLQAFYLPDDEMRLHLVEAPSVEAVSRLIRRTGLSHDRIVEAVVSAGLRIR